jgi:hypothetical protein
MVPDLAGLLRTLVDGQIEFVTIGGIAVAAHRVVRATEDVDIVPNPSAENITRLADRLAAIDARLLRNPDRGIDEGVRAGLHRGRNVTVTSGLGDLDIVQRLPGVPSYQELHADGWDANLFGVRFRVCSREHLVAMKRARGDANDLADIERLASD